MKISRVPIESSSAHGSIVDEEYYVGSVNHEDRALLLSDAEAFFKKADVPVPPGAQIDIAVRQHPERRLAKSKRGGTRPFSGVEVLSKAAVGVGGGSGLMLCRITIVRIDGFIIVHVECIPIIVIACW
jgi:hypothetical protein